jgi:hypothetical protein
MRWRDELQVVAHVLGEWLAVVRLELVGVERPGETALLEPVQIAAQLVTVAVARHAADALSRWHLQERVDVGRRGPREFDTIATQPAVKQNHDALSVVRRLIAQVRERERRQLDAMLATHSRVTLYRASSDSMARWNSAAMSAIETLT